MCGTQQLLECVKIPETFSFSTSSYTSNAPEEGEQKASKEENIIFEIWDCYYKSDPLY